MRSISMNQMTLELQPRLAERFGSLREFLAHRVREQVKPRALRTVEELSGKLQQALEALKA